jgi:anaerobic C4-dicarboxylate transporter
MAEFECLTPEEARLRLLAAFRRSGDEEFVETLKRPLLNPIEQRDTKGKRKVHPMLIVAMVLVLVAVASVVFFSLQA